MAGYYCHFVSFSSGPSKIFSKIKKEETFAGTLSTHNSFEITLAVSANGLPLLFTRRIVYLRDYILFFAVICHLICHSELFKKIPYF